MNAVSTILIALWVLVANLGLTQAMHYCQGSAVASKIAIGSKPEASCCTASKRTPCKMPDTASDSRKPSEPMPGDCCEDEFQYIELSDNVTSAYQWLVSAPTASIQAEILPLFGPPIYPFYYIGFLPIAYHPPPPPWQDYQAWSQVFLI